MLFLNPIEKVLGNRSFRSLNKKLSKESNPAIAYALSLTVTKYFAVALTEKELIHFRKPLIGNPFEKRISIETIQEVNVTPTATNHFMMNILFNNNQNYEFKCHFLNSANNIKELIEQRIIKKDKVMGEQLNTEVGLTPPKKDDCAIDEKTNNDGSITVNETVGAKQQGNVSEKSSFETLSFSVAGVSFDNRQDILHKLAKKMKNDFGYDYYEGYTAKEMKEFQGVYYQYDGFEFGDYIQLVPDPTNKHDKNAVKIILEYPEGKEHLIGFIPKKENKNKKVLDILNNDYSYGIHAEFTGGKLKEVEEEYDDDDFLFEKPRLTIVENELTLGVLINIRYAVGSDKYD